MSELDNNTDDEGSEQTHAQFTFDEITLDATLSDLACLVQSPTRLKILDLLQQSSRTPAELRDVLNIHRTTLQRNLETLREKQCIQSAPTDNVYRLTTPGQLFLETFQQWLDTARTASQLGSFLDHFPESVPVDSDCLRDCSITSVEPYNPHAPMGRFLDLLTASETVQLFVPLIHPRQMSTIADHLTGWSIFELISTVPAFKRLTTKQPSATETVLESTTVRLLSGGTSPSVGTGMIDKTAIIVVYDEKGNMHALLEATSEQPKITKWIKRQYTQRKQNASPARSYPTFR